MPTLFEYDPEVARRIAREDALSGALFKTVYEAHLARQASDPSRTVPVNFSEAERFARWVVSEQLRDVGVLE